MNASFSSTHYSQHANQRIALNWRWFLLSVTLMTSFWSVAGPETRSVRVAHLTGEQTRYYSHIHWQSQPGAGIPVRFLPSVNATAKDIYSTKNLSGKEHHTEIRTIPDQLDNLLRELVNNTGFLTTVEQHPEYLLQFHIREWDTLYLIGDSNHWLSQGFAHIDRTWSQVFGDNKPATTALTLTVYDTYHRLLLEVPIRSQLEACERSSYPMSFSPNVNQQFLDGFSSSTTGQSLIATVNRALEVASVYFKDAPIQGQVLHVDNNDIYLNIGEGTVFPGEQLKLIYRQNSSLPNYTVGRLEVDRVYPDMAIVHSLDVKSGNVLPGDQVKMNKVMQQRQFISVAGNAIRCLQPKAKPFTFKAPDPNHKFSWQKDSE